MKWITELSIENYRAFTKKETIKIPFGSHLLVYGENGSGKSSIYNALRDFFISTDNAEKLMLNHFEKQNGNNNGNIEVEISDSSKPPNINNYRFAEPDSDSNHRNVRELLLANKVKGFLDYKGLLKTYLVESASGQNPNLFDLLVEDLLADHKIKRISGYGSAEDELLKQWVLIKTPLLKNNYDGRKTKCKDAKSYLPEFERELTALLTKVFVVFKRFITEYFDRKLEVDVQISNMTFNYNTFEISKGVFLNIKYAGQTIPIYQHFLNEARLSAMASCIYLASISQYPIDETFEIKPLFLDDVFIGLDTNNRIPLLKLLHEEFIKKDYQIFISTYDRQWFELARHWFTNKAIHIKCLEMFIESDDNPLNPDAPVVLPDNGGYEKAMAHFKAKDYPAAGNYLRKECESIIKKLLPDAYRIDRNCKEIKELEDLLNQLKLFYDNCNVQYPTELINALKIYRKILLNPSSHDDVKGPLFRKEIQDAFNLVSALQLLQKIDRKKVLVKSQILTICFPTDDYEIEIEPDRDIWVVNNNGTKQFSNFDFHIQKWIYHTIVFGEKNPHGTIIRESQQVIDKDTSAKWSIEKLFDKINRCVGMPIPADLYANINIGTGGTLRDLL